jgi:hypothetical protein
MLRYIRPSPPDWYKAGAAIWDHLGFEIDNEWTAEMLGLKHADDALTRACQAALLNVLATGGEGEDLESAMFGLASLVHSHPRFADVTIADAWHLPFGENTAYQPLRVGQQTTPTKSKKKRL